MEIIVDTINLQINEAIIFRALNVKRRQWFKGSSLKTFGWEGRRRNFCLLATGILRGNPSAWLPLISRPNSPPFHKLYNCAAHAQTRKATISGRAKNRLRANDRRKRMVGWAEVARTLWIVWNWNSIRRMESHCRIIIQNDSSTGRSSLWIFCEI